MMKIRKAVNRLTIIIENILLDDALEMNLERAKKEKFDLRDVIGDARATGLPEEDSRLKITLVEGPLLFEGNRLRIEMALRNVIQNALKYSPPASVIDLRCQLIEDVFFVDISNSGNPIPESERGTLFERYFRGAHSSRIPGSGLGLHISRAIARQHGGDVVLISSDMERTTFRLSLPLKTHRSGAGSSPSTPVASSW
jgi:signal transduction histidine kinase